MTDLLIPRADLFGNPSRLAGTISPDGSTLAWVAPLDGVLNIWAAPIAVPDQGRPVTQDSGRGISIYFWAYDGHHLLSCRITAATRTGACMLSMSPLPSVAL